MNNKDEIGISFVIPCFNEMPDVLRDTINRIVNVLHSKNICYEIIVVNDGSNKYSYDFVDGENIRVVDHDVNMGYGSSLKTGIRSAAYEWIGIIDSDGTYPVESFNDMMSCMSKYDMVIGSRDWSDISLVRTLAKKPLTKLATFIAGYPIPDLNSGMRLFKRRIVDDHIRVYPARFSFSTTLTMVGLTNAFEIKFMPVKYFKRIGKSSIQPIKDTMRFVIQIFRLALYFKPLRFFVPLSVMVAALAVLRGVRDVVLDNHFGGLTLVLFFMAFQIFFFGLLAEIINKK